MKWIALIASTLILAACGYSSAVEYRQVTVQPTGVVRTVPAVTTISSVSAVVPAATTVTVVNDDPVDLAVPSDDWDVTTTTVGYY